MTHACVSHPGLSSGEIHVWAAQLVDDPRATAAFLRILDREERARATRLSFERDRLRYIQAHGIVRRILANYTGGDAATLTFARNRHGKPRLVSRANALNLQFSVSHSGNCCMLAVRLDHPVGIDVEKVRDLPHAMDIAQSYFTPTESRALAALRGSAQREAFLLLWTHKEAAVKGLGISLAASLGRIEFDLDQVESPRLVAWEGDRSAAHKWSILRVDPAPGYVAALVSGHPIHSLTLQTWKDAGAIDALSPLRSGWKASR